MGGAPLNTSNDKTGMMDGFSTANVQKYLGGNQAAPTPVAAAPTPAPSPQPPIGPAPAVNMNNIAPAPQQALPPAQQSAANPLQAITPSSNPQMQPSSTGMSFQDAYAPLLMHLSDLLGQHGQGGQS